MSATFGAPPQIINTVYNLTPDALEEIAQWLETRGLRTPISQIVGFSQFTGKSDTVAAFDTTDSVPYVDLTHTGPELTGLADGNYLVFHGALASVTTAGDAAFMSLSVNGSTPDDADCCRTNLDTATSMMRLTTKRLAAGGNNSIKAQYRSSTGNTVGFLNRWLVVLRYANL